MIIGIIKKIIIKRLEKIQTDNENRIQQEEDRKNKAEKEKEAEEMVS